MVTLFDIPLSPYAQKIKLALLEKQIPFEVHPVDLWQPDAIFLAASPRAQAPALQSGDLAVFDSTIILEYLEDRWPERPLLPRSPEARARTRMLEDVCDTTYDAINWSVMEVTVFERATGELASHLLETARQQVAEVNAWLETQLDAKDWFGGEDCLWADISAYPYVNGAAAQGNKPPQGSALEAWLKAMRGRASAQRVREDIRAYLAQRREGRTWRTYRDHRLEWMMRSGGQQIVLDGLADGSVRFASHTFR